MRVSYLAYLSAAAIVCLWARGDAFAVESANTLSSIETPPAPAHRKLHAAVTFEETQGLRGSSPPTGKEYDSEDDDDDSSSIESTDSRESIDSSDIEGKWEFREKKAREAEKAKEEAAKPKEQSDPTDGLKGGRPSDK
ncbi:unnamed protein product [Hyaloperonospora brassicae]|uniref:RxLR effector candidate protein n=1 Tax=Hyaloperonospora brassicae TaxID=162125 RepID=A0AAV0UC84_HYABA|nr:unnamed protein product [Hyaloperonospora brassicae]